MDLDLANVRAFLAVADERSFGQAAASLFITQQALSARIRRLEEQLGARLFDRDSRRVILTAAGERFLPHAQRMLSASDAGLDAVQEPRQPVRVDVWGQEHTPLGLLRVVSEVLSPGGVPPIEISMRCSTSAAFDALLHGDIDLAFGRVHDLDQPRASGLSHRLIHLTPHVVAASTGHRHASATVLRADDLRDGGVFWPMRRSGQGEVRGYLTRFGKHFDVPVHFVDSDLEPDRIVEVLTGAGPPKLSLVNPDWPTSTVPGVRLVPFDPVPRYPWSVIWRSDDRGQQLRRLLDLTFEAAHTRGWLSFDTERDWLPDVDLADLLRG